MTENTIGTKSTKAVIDRHNAVVAAGDLDAIVDDYSADAVILTPGGVRTGHSGVREFFEEILERLAGMDLEIINTRSSGDYLFLEWVGRSPEKTVSDGVDTFVVENGKIALQSVRYTLVSTASS